MTTQNMIDALTTSTNNLVRRICTDIKEGRDTIAHQKTICGKFLQKVFEGDYVHAFRIADNNNKHAFIRWLIQEGHEEKAQQLISRTGFDPAED